MTDLAMTIVVAAPEKTMPSLSALAAYLEEVGTTIVSRDKCPVPTTLHHRRCCELWRVSAVGGDLSRSRLAAIGNELKIDINLQSSEQRLRDYRLAVFDMDSTLVECEVIDLLAERAGVGERVAAITERAMRGEIDFDQSFKERLGLLKGLSSDVLDELLSTLPFVEGGRELMLSLRSLGIKTVIVSGGFDVFASHVASVLGMDGYLANTLAIADNRLTGEPVMPIVNANTKRDQLLTLAHELGVTAEQSIAVGDGANDLAMLGAAGLGVAFHAKPVVRAQAGYQVSHTGLDSLLYFLGHRGELAQ